jgi:hypothetical protein
VERRRFRDPDPQASQSGARQAAVIFTRFLQSVHLFPVTAFAEAAYQYLYTEYPNEHDENK